MLSLDRVFSFHGLPFVGVFKQCGGNPRFGLLVIFLSFNISDHLAMTQWATRDRKFEPLR